DSVAEDIISIIIHPKHKASVNHDSQRVQALGDGLVVAAKVVSLVAPTQVLGNECFKSNEDAAQSRFSRSFDQVAAENRIHGRCALEETAHTFHPFEEGPGKATVAEQVVV